MKHKVGEKVVVVNPYSGSDFEDGEIVTIVRIGDVDGFEPDCYGAVRDSEKYLWYLYEDEVKPLTNADRIRTMSDEGLAEFLSTKLNDDFYDWPDLTLQWLQQPAEEDFT